MVDKICEVDRFIIPALVSNIGGLLDNKIKEIKRVKVLHNFSKSTEYEIECYEGEEVHRLYLEGLDPEPRSEQGTDAKSKSRDGDDREDPSGVDENKIDFVKSYLKIQISPDPSTISAALNNIAGMENLYGKRWALVLKFYLRRIPQPTNEDYVISPSIQYILSEETSTDYNVNWVDDGTIIVEISDVGLIPVDFLEK